MPVVLPYKRSGFERTSNAGVPNQQDVASCMWCVTMPIYSPKSLDLTVNNLSFGRFF